MAGSGECGDEPPCSGAAQLVKLVSIIIFVLI
jgi:hypothetical protein